MVLSSSSVESLQTLHSSYTIFTKQATFAAIGLPLAVGAAFVPVRAWKALAWPLLIVGFGALVLVLVAGTTVNGNQNWARLRGLAPPPAGAGQVSPARP